MRNELFSRVLGIGLRDWSSVVPETLKRVLEGVF